MNAVGRYEIVRRIGVGGMGEVFFAWAYGVARTRKPVVVKVLRGEMLAEPGAPEMFVEEGRLSLRLSHSNILQVFDFGKADDRYFMAMEYVDGYHLGELRKRNGGKLEPEHAAFAAMEVCMALDYAHRLKDDTSGVPLHIVHRDVTPSNILISREGEVKLADFGIARAVGRSQHTQAGQIRGKVRYMAPEAARGEPLDHRADLFSLGAILFELLTGQRAFEGKGREAILQQVVGSRVVAPSSIDASLPAALDDVVFRATAPKREERFPDAFAMHRALEGACRKSGLLPSRGSFLEFLRALDASDPVVDESRSQEAQPPTPPRAAAPRSGRTQNGPMGRVTPSAQQPGVPPPSSGAGTSAGRGGVQPEQAPIAGATAAVAPPPSSGTPGARSAVGGRTANSASASSKPSSSTGSVPPPVKGPDTALPTGVASPVVLFTLTVAGEMTPSFSGGADVSDLPRFEVTRGEGIDTEFRDVDRITPKRDQDSVARRDDEFSATPEPLFPDRVSLERTVAREPTPMDEPSNEPTVPPEPAPRTPSRSRVSASVSAPLLEVPVDMPVQEDTKPPMRMQPENTPVPHEPSNEQTVSPSGSGGGAAAAETAIRMRPSLESGSSSASAGPRGRTGSGAFRAVAPEVEPRTADTDRRDSRSSSASRDTIDHVDESIDASGRWRRRGEMPDEAPDVDFPALRRKPPSRTPLLAGAFVLLVVLTGWLGVQIFGGGSEPVTTPTPRSTIAVRTPPATTLIAVGTTAPILAPTATPVAATPTPVPTRTAVAFSTKAATPTPVRTQRPAATQASAPVYGQLVINTTPWSEVRIGGRLLGNTPLKNVRLTAGRHTLTFRNPVSGLEKSVEVDVIANETRPVLVELK